MEVALPAIVPIEPSQVAAAARVLADAFSDAPRFRLLVPDDEARRRKLPGYWAVMLRLAAAASTAYTTGGTVQGVAIWAAPRAKAPSPLAHARSGSWLLPARLGLAAYRRRGAVARVLQAMAAAAPHWYLDTIGVAPTAQRRGVGKALIEHVLVRADAERLPAYLDTSAEWNLPYYKRFGFAVTAECRLPNGVPVWGMTREPQ